MDGPKVKVLFIRNLTVNTTEDDISAAFEEASNGQIERVRVNTTLFCTLTIKKEPLFTLIWHIYYKKGTS